MIALAIRSRPGRACARIVAALVVAAIGLAMLPPVPAGAVPGQPACTHVIDPEVNTVDTARAAFSDIGPGAVLCLPAGTRGNIKLVNLNGTAEQPITVRNQDGPVTITGTRFADGGIIINGSTHLRVTGSGGDQLACGFPYARDSQRCGIIIDGAQKGVLMNTDKGDLHDIEIDHVAVMQVSQEKKTRAIAIHPISGQLIGGIHIHHSYVSNSLAEGIYIGSEPHGQPFETLAKVERVHVHHNVVENTGYDGIKLKVAVRDVAVHDNLVRNSGLSRTAAHEGGIKLALSVGDYYRNVVINAVEGIRSGRDLEEADTRYFDNVVINALQVGLEAKESGAQVFHNMVIGSEDIGISALGRETVVRDNIVIGATDPLSIQRPHVVSGNLVGEDVEMGYWDPDTASPWMNPNVILRRLQGALALR